MEEIKIFVDINEENFNTIIICAANAQKLGVSEGGTVSIVNPDNNQIKDAKVEISDMVLDFAGQVSKNIIDDLNFVGIELIVRPSLGAPAVSSAPAPTLQAPQPHLPGISAPAAAPTSAPAPIATPTPAPTFAPTPAPMPTPAPQPTLTQLPTRPAGLSPPPGSMPQSMPSPQPMPSQIPSQSAPMPSVPALEPAIPIDPYPNRIDINNIDNLNSLNIQFLDYRTYNILRTKLTYPNPELFGDCVPNNYVPFFIPQGNRSV